LTQLLLSPPAHDLRTLAGYLTLTGAATMVGGWLALRIGDRAIGFSIRTKAFLSSAIGTGVALLNVLIVAQLMFVSTGHDLKLLVALTGLLSYVGLAGASGLLGDCSRSL
jgi:hypothetical protein